MVVEKASARSGSSAFEPPSGERVKTGVTVINSFFNRVNIAVLVDYQASAQKATQVENFAMPPWPIYDPWLFGKGHGIYRGFC